MPEMTFFPQRPASHPMIYAYEDTNPQYKGLLKVGYTSVDVDKPAADKLKTIRFEKHRQKYKAEHDDELRTFYMAERKLKPHFNDGKLPITAWRKEREQLEQEYKDAVLKRSACCKARCYPVAGLVAGEILVLSDFSTFDNQNNRKIEEKENRKSTVKPGMFRGF